MKLFHPEGRVQDLLIAHAGSKRKPSTDASYFEKFGIPANSLHSAASRAMRDDPHFHASWKDGEWIYYRDETSRNRLIDTPKKARRRRPVPGSLPLRPKVKVAEPKPNDPTVNASDDTIRATEVYIVVNFERAGVCRIPPDVARCFYAQLKALYE